MTSRLHPPTPTHARLLEVIRKRRFRICRSRSSRLVTISIKRILLTTFPVFFTMHAFDRRTDGQTDRIFNARPRLHWTLDARWLKNNTHNSRVSTRRNYDTFIWQASGVYSTEVQDQDARGPIRLNMQAYTCCKVLVFMFIAYFSITFAYHASVTFIEP